MKRFKMQVLPDHFDKETIMIWVKLVSWGAAIAVGVFGGTSGIEETEHQKLHRSEAQAGQMNAEVAVYGAYDNYRDYIMDVERHKAACDAALTGFSRHRTDERDWRHVLEECHSQGEIE